MIYKWKEAFPGRAVPAQVVGERLEQIAKRVQLTPKAVVDDARPTNSPLHPCFEWNDQVAAEKWRQEQAGAILRNIEVVIEDASGKDREVRAFVNVTQDDDRQYTSIAKAMRSPELRRQVLDTALRELESWRTKYGELRELADLLAAVDQTILRFTAEKIGDETSTGKASA